MSERDATPEACPQMGDVACDGSCSSCQPPVPPSEPEARPDRQAFDHAVSAASGVFDGVRPGDEGPPSEPEHDYTICDGLCVPDECVCPSVEQRTAEVKAAVLADRERIIGIIEDEWGNLTMAQTIAEIRGGQHE